MGMENEEKEEEGRPRRSGRNETRHQKGPDPCSTYAISRQGYAPNVSHHYPFIPFDILLSLPLLFDPYLIDIVLRPRSYTHIHIHIHLRNGKTTPNL
jgi:hypothetical protein